MKKITFILLALISGTAFSQTASATGTASAKIVSPLEITAGNDLIFGDITPNAGKVVVKPAGYDASNTTATIVGGTVPTPATFTVNAALGFNYTVTLPGTVTLTDAESGETMTVSNFSHDSTEFGSGSNEVFHVGGNLTVLDGQASGTYTGTVTVGVAYQ